jgi:hypothetical protein
MESTVETMTDHVVPDLLDRLRRGEVVNNPCTKVKSVIFRSGGGTYNATLKSNPAKYSIITGDGSLTHYQRSLGFDPGLKSATLSPTLGDSQQMARSQALAAVDKAPYAVAEDIATIRETVRFLRKPFSGLDDLSSRFQKAVRGLSKIRKKSFWTRANGVASIWLEYRFGFMPTVRSIDNVLNSLNRPTDKRYNRILTAHGTDERKTALQYDKAVSAPFTYERTVQLERVCRAVVQYRVSPPLREWQYKYGLRFKDVPELMWDLFPLSFMYDRVLNVGNAIRGLSNFLDPAIVILGGTQSVKTLTSQSIRLVSQSNASWNINITPDTDGYFTEAYDRSVWKPNVLNIVPPVVPGDLVKDLTSIADLSALVYQRLR